LNVLSSLLQNGLQVLPEEDLGRAKGIAVSFVGGGVVVEDHPADLLRGGTTWNPSLQEATISVFRKDEKKFENIFLDKYFFAIF
jgi:hypothetical protein